MVLGNKNNPNFIKLHLHVWSFKNWNKYIQTKNAKKRACFKHQKLDLFSVLNSEHATLVITSDYIWVFHDRPFRRISVRLSDRSKVTQHKINFVKKCPQWGLNSQPPDHQSHALLTELARNLLEMSEVSFLLFHAPLHMLDFVYF